MTDLLELQKEFIKKHLFPGGIAADYTMGNGHDTLFLSRTAGPRGRVYAFDVQAAALQSTALRLCRGNAPQNYVLIHDSHHNAGKYVTQKVNAGMFNLGWLPGSDRTVFTRRETTLPAIAGAIERMAPDGILLVAVYPGHSEGDAEGKLIHEYLSSLDRRKYMCALFRITNSPASPFFYIIEN
ncbi:MAG: class I SAM-dependent methyltransferase [Clostridia bacterium]|nr:class I SAM-dependent methyltransferase [Clostridia bacterium]